MQRPQIIALVATLLLLVAGFFVWQHLQQLSGQITSLNQQVQDLGEQAEAARTQATEAEARAREAENSAGMAAERAEEAIGREQMSAEQAREADEARAVAEAEAEQAAEEKKRAELVARLSEEAEAVADAKRLEAEKEREEAATRAAVAELEAQRAKKETEEVRRRLEREMDRMQRALSKIADTQRTALGVVMTLDSSQIEFDFNKAEVRPENREILSRIAGVLSTFDEYGVQIFGHTDDVGSVDYNLQLSKQRAEAVKAYLVTAGIPEGVLTTQGLGKGSPRVQGTDPESRQRNRRVELAIVFSEGEYGAAVDAEAGGN